MKPLRNVAVAIAVLTATVAGAAAVGSKPTSHAFEPSPIGTPRLAAALESVVDVPGPVVVETVVAAEWAVARSGVVNLSHPRAVAEGLEDGDEAILIMFHALRHPTQGLFLVDTGVERAFSTDRERSLFGGVVGKAMHAEKVQMKNDTASWLSTHGPASGVLLTHLHLDHIAGLRDVPAGTPVYAGPGEAEARNAVNWLVAPITDAALAGKPPVREWRFAPEATGAPAVVDVFDDGTVWALHVPGHTRGSTAYVARTAAGPVLLVGDASHTAWGWEHGVEPGDFSEDRPASAENLARLRALVERHPGIDVRLGHQHLARTAAQASHIAR